MMKRYNFAKFLSKTCFITQKMSFNLMNFDEIFDIEYQTESKKTIWKEKP